MSLHQYMEFIKHYEMAIQQRDQAPDCEPLNAYVFALENAMRILGMADSIKGAE